MRSDSREKGTQYGKNKGRKDRVHNNHHHKMSSNSAIATIAAAKQALRVIEDGKEALC